MTEHRLYIIVFVHVVQLLSMDIVMEFCGLRG